MTARDLVTKVFLELNAFAPGDPIPEDDAQYALDETNALLDEWAARKAYAYNVTFSVFTLVPNLAPHTIGPNNATFNVPQRPTRLESAAIILNNQTPNVDQPLNLRDDAWWADERVKNLTTNLPTDLYYSPDFPNGSLNFWPVPNFAYGVRLELWGILSQIASLQATFSMPPAYLNAIKYSVAERIANPYGAQAVEMVSSQTFQKKLSQALKAVQINNQTSPRVASADYGMRGQKGNRPTFNYYSGQ